MGITLEPVLINLPQFREKLVALCHPDCYLQLPQNGLHIRQNCNILGISAGSPENKAYNMQTMKPYPTSIVVNGNLSMGFNQALDLALFILPQCLVL